jgi:hypothetical protein
MSRIPVEIVPDTGGSSRCVIRNAVRYAVSRLLDDQLEGGVHPWELPALRREAISLEEVEVATIVEG